VGRGPYTALLAIYSIASRLQLTVSSGETEGAVKGGLNRE